MVCLLFTITDMMDGILINLLLVVVVCSQSGCGPQSSHLKRGHVALIFFSFACNLSASTRLEISNANPGKRVVDELCI